MSVTKKMENLIKECASLNARLSGRLKPSCLDILIWVSPSSCRNPEETMFWHPHYLRKPVAAKVIIYFYTLCICSIIGIARFFSYGGFFYNSLKRGSEILLVIPDKITDHSPMIKTSYLAEDDGFVIDKVVFSRLKNIGSRFHRFSLVARLKIFITVWTAVISDIRERWRSKKINVDYFDSLIIFLQWFALQPWHFHMDFYYFIRKLVSDSPGYKVLFSVHEMNFYSKIMWRVAEEKGLTGVTAQHAMIISEKLWYFPQKVELEAGCPTPDKFFVYSQRVKDKLEPFYSKTEFLSCCSPRFSKWKSKKAGSPGMVVTADKSSLLFVGGIMSCDTTILIRAIKELLRTKGQKRFDIKLRLHPYAYINKLDKLWIRRASAGKKIKISGSSLVDDLSGAALVIGCNSTVLHEAALLGIPVLSLNHDGYVHPAILPDTDRWTAPINDSLWDRIERQLTIRPDDDLVNSFKSDMGVFSPDLTTKLIYEKLA